MGGKRRSQATQDVRALLADLMSWHMNSMGAPRELRALRERVALLTGRTDLQDHRPDDLLQDVEDYMEGL